MTHRAKHESAALSRRDVMTTLLAGVLTGSAGFAGIAAAAPTRPDEMPDWPLQDAFGKPARWRSQVLADHVVIVNFVYTTCGSLCPVVSALMADLQLRLRSRAPVALVSLSLDPLTDTPQSLRRFAAPFAPGPRWWWLTGEVRTMHRLLDALDAGPGPDLASHGPQWLIGRAGRGAWRRLVDLPPLAHFQSAVDALQ
jgi:protein SCO1/2